jgi:hypothetical protein
MSDSPCFRQRRVRVDKSANNDLQIPKFDSEFDSCVRGFSFIKIDHALLQHTDYTNTVEQLFTPCLLLASRSGPLQNAKITVLRLILNKRPKIRDPSRQN